MTNHRKHLLFTLLDGCSCCEGSGSCSSSRGGGDGGDGGGGGSGSSHRGGCCCFGSGTSGAIVHTQLIIIAYLLILGKDHAAGYFGSH